ncbi:MAG: carbohydrate ABC transporter permease [Treponema sp.]|nr:carbohydrate ABC transporter permease [Treponema sp.]
MKSQKHILFVRRTIIYFVLSFLMVLSLFPFVVLIINSTRLHSEIMKGFSIIPGSYLFLNLKNLLANKNTPVLLALGNSVIISLFNAAFATYFSAMTAYGIYMYRFKLRSTAFKFIMAIMMVPTQVTALGFLQLITKMHMEDTRMALIIPAVASPIAFFYMLQYLSATLPHSIVEAARVDGCNEFVTFNIIVLPILKPAIAVQGIFAFVNSWNNYFLPALILNSREKKTIPILIAQLRNADFMKFDMAQVYMLICIAIIPLLIVYLLMSRSIIGGVTLGSVKE